MKDRYIDQAIQIIKDRNTNKKETRNVVVASTAKVNTQQNNQSQIPSLSRNATSYHRKLSQIESKTHGTVSKGNSFNLQSKKDLFKEKIKETESSSSFSLTKKESSNPTRESASSPSSASSSSSSDYERHPKVI